MRRLKGKRGQSTVEYVIVFTAIAVAIIFAASQIITPALNDTYDEAAEGIRAGADYFGNTIGMGHLDN
ncbi:hypothetical protein ACFL2J_00240 [Candidatus Omnitrophota bacterium]